jgi:hypothetical protein
LAKTRRPHPGAARGGAGSYVRVAGGIFVSVFEFSRLPAYRREGSPERLLRAAVHAFCSLPRPTRREIDQLDDLAMPLIEKASLTDPDDAVLLEAWSSILASASKEARANHALFVDILSNLDAKHLQFLEFIGKTSDRSGKIDEFLGLSEDEILNIAEESINEITNNDLDEESGSNLLSTKLGNATRTRGSILIAGGMDRENVNIRQTFEIFGERNFGEFPEFITGALENMSLIRRNRISHNRFLGIDLRLDYHILTMYGFEFLYACKGRSIYEE